MKPFRRREAIRIRPGGFELSTDSGKDGRKLRSVWAGRLVTFCALALALFCYFSLLRYSNIYVLVGQSLIWLLALWNRRWPVYALALLFPFFGNQPGAPYGMYFINMTLWFVVGRWLWLRWRRGLSPFVYTRITPWILLFWFVSACSMLPHLREQAHNILASQGWMRGIFKSYEATAFDPLFPVHAFLNLTLSLLFFFYLVDQWRRYGERMRLLRNLWFAVVVAMLFGFLDFVRILPLEWFRPPNPEILKFGYPRLQSFFWHSGWFAQWLVLLAPVGFAFALYTKPRILSSWRMAAGFFAFFAVVVMLLTYQRGGWLALAGGYGVVILLYMARQFGSSRGKKRVLILLLVLFVGGGAGVGSILVLSKDQKTSLVQRLRHTGELRDRTVIWQSALSLSKQHPFLGVGLGRYYTEHVIQFPKGHPFYSIDKGEAHNTYLHVLAERGPLALVFLFGIFFVSIRIFLKEWGAAAADSPRSWWIAGALGMCAAWLIYGGAQYMSYINVVDLTFWILLTFALIEAKGVARLRSPRNDLVILLRDQTRRRYLGGALETLIQKQLPDDLTVIGSGLPAPSQQGKGCWIGLSISGLAWLLGPLVFVVVGAVILRFLFGSLVEHLPAAQSGGYGVFSYGLFLASGFVPAMLLVGAIPLAVRRPEFSIRQLGFLQMVRLVLMGAWMLFFMGALAFLVDIPMGGRWRTLLWIILGVLIVLNLSLLVARIYRLLVERNRLWRVFMEPLLLILILAAPILYPWTALPQALRAVLLANPVVPVVRMGQRLFFEQRSIGWTIWVALLFWTALFAVVAHRLGKGKEVDRPLVVGSREGSEHGAEV